MLAPGVSLSPGTNALAYFDEGKKFYDIDTNRDFAEGKLELNFFLGLLNRSKLELMHVSAISWRVFEANVFFYNFR